MKVLVASAEVAPFFKVGGLGDVAGSLPIELVKNNVDARVILPKYGRINEKYTNEMEYLTHIYIKMGWRSQYCGVFKLVQNGVTFYFIDNEYYFNADSVYAGIREDVERYIFFCKAVLAVLQCIDFYPDVLHCNDWQTGLIPVLLKAHYYCDSRYTGIKTLMTIHNLKFQGRYSIDFVSDLADLPEDYFTPDKLEFYRDANLLKGGIVYADRINTVSPTYMEEIKEPYAGEGLDGMLFARRDSLSGIINGINYDEYNPETNSMLEVNFNRRNFVSKKRENKVLLQRDLNLPQNEKTMMISMVSRLTEQKGFDLLECIIEELLNDDIQLVVLGTGDARYENMLKHFAWKYPEKLSAQVKFDTWLSHKLYASSDAFLMPSQFEPCGLSQMIAMHYGTVPIVRETGGLKDTVIPYNEYEDTGYGFSFTHYNAHDMLHTIRYAEQIYQNAKAWQGLQRRCMAQDFSWTQSAKSYIALYESMI